MCGLTGYYAFHGQVADLGVELETSLQSITHRGPDHQGYYHSKNLGFGHARLSIVDLSENGNQPMSDHSGRYILIYNGECYNHMELREKLSSKNIPFVSQSDTESVLYWLIEKGGEGLKQINGFFSLAMYDTLNRKLLIARDRFGIKPMHYRVEPEAIYFGSELSAVKAFKKELSIKEDSLSAYMHLNYIPSPHTIHREIKKLHPGTYLTVNNWGKIEMHRYFSPHYGNKNDEQNLVELFKTKLEDSVKKRLMSDVPLGCFLSGGLDSSLVTGLAARNLDKLKTYTIVFKGEKQFDESADAALVARHFNTEHHEIEIEEEDLIESINHILDHVDEPFADSSAIAMHNLCKHVQKDVKVALSGDGGDELFAGYRKHHALYSSHRFPFLSKLVGLSNPLFNLLPRSREKGLLNSLRKWEKFTASAALSPSERYWKWAGYGNPKEEIYKNLGFNYKTFMDEVYETEILSFDDCLKMDLTMVLEGDMLVKTDRMSMLQGIEVRVPFLDHELVNIVNNIPANKKINLFSMKRLLKDNFKEFLPVEILRKPKQGFEVPLKKWLNTELESKMEELLSAELIKEQGLFDLDNVRELKSMLKSSHSANSEYSVWSLMVFNSWWLKEQENKFSV